LLLSVLFLGFWFYFSDYSLIIINNNNCASFCYCFRSFRFTFFFFPLSFFRLECNSDCRYAANSIRSTRHIRSSELSHLSFLLRIRFSLLLLFGCLV
jgi:hypothetical protein